MPSNIQTYITNTSSGILTLNEGALEFANKKSKIKPMPFKDNLMQPKLMEQQPSNCMDRVLEEPKVLSMTRIEPSKADHGLVEVDHSNPPNNDTRLSNGSEKIAKEVAKTSPKPSQAKRKFVIFLGNFSKKMTRTEGPFKDVTQFLANHSGPKGTNKSKEVMRLFIRSPSKASGNPSSKDYCEPWIMIQQIVKL
jgi:hypothetical protein